MGGCVSVNDNKKLPTGTSTQPIGIPLDSIPQSKKGPGGEPIGESGIITIIKHCDLNPENFVKMRTETPQFYKYPDGTQVQRNPSPVPVELTPWNVDFPNYSPSVYTAQVVLDNDVLVNPKGWADPQSLMILKSNNFSVADELRIGEERVRLYGVKRASEMMAQDKCKLRFSHTGPLRYDKDGYPLCPVGRTGLDGRGTLGNWGPNHAADPIVCRIHTSETTGKLTLQFVLIKRKDNGQWALPGGIVEAGQNIADTRTREFAEEALSSVKKDDESDAEHQIRVKILQEKLKKIFEIEPKECDIVYKGVVDDPRNTDKSWMETMAILTVLDGEFADMKLEAGDDAGKAKWQDYYPGLELFASHRKFVDKAVQMLTERNIVDINGIVIEK